MLGRRGGTLFGGSGEQKFTLGEQERARRDLETVGIHDMLREICITKAEEEGFLHHVSSKANSGKELIENPYRRLKIHCTKHFQEWKIQDSSVRSILLFSERYEEPRLSLHSRHIGVLDAPRVTWWNLSRAVSTFVNLRYFAFSLHYAVSPDEFLASISKHANLETINVHVIDPDLLEESDNLWRVRYEILKMPNLRHLIWNDDFLLSRPSDTGIVHESGLQTIETVIDFIFDEETVKILVNLKKLKVKYYNVESCSWDYFNLDNLFHLQNLEEFRIYMNLGYRSWTWNHAFPITLKKLTLQCVPLPWENMSIIGSLPNLQVLEMTNMSVSKLSEWKTVEGQFLQLKYLCSSFDLLVKWEMEKEHFPCLESLIFAQSEYMKKIPSGIGEIDTLRYIELQYCNKSLVYSAQQIQKDQLENGSDSIRVSVIGLDEYEFNFE